jgi:hypothetical protein
MLALMARTTRSKRTDVLTTNKALSRFLVCLVGIIALVGCAGEEAMEEISRSETGTNIEFQSPDPEEFLRAYFHAAVNERNYEHLWTLATESFNDVNYGGEYQIFVDFWNSVESLEIETIDIPERSNSAVVCNVKMTLRIGGNDILTETNYHLIYDEDKASWVFESP